MKYLILLLFPIFLNAQVVDYSYPTNAFSGTDTVQTFKFYKFELDTSSVDSTEWGFVRTLFYTYNQNNNTKSAEIIADQSGTSDPTYLTVSSDIGIIDFTYDAVGTYLLEDRINSFNNNKTFVFIQNRNGSNNYTIDYDYVDSNTIRIYTKSGGTLTNGILNKCYIKILNFK